MEVTKYNYPIYSAFGLAAAGCVPIALLAILLCDWTVIAVPLLCSAGGKNKHYVLQPL